MKSTKIVFENGDIRIYCYINGILDKTCVVPTLEYALMYAEKYEKTVENLG